MSGDGNSTAGSSAGETHVEIERKFLVAGLPDDIGSYPNTHIRQGYLVISTDGEEVRLRQQNDRYLQSVKAGSGLKRVQFETELTQSQFGALWPATEGKRVVKTRFEIGHGRHVIELDRFEADLDGLLIAEVEFDSVADAESFEPPSWFGREVTDDERYKNRNLALHGLPSS